MCPDVKTSFPLSDPSPIGCGASAVFAELTVYPRAPGTVVRCRSCESVLMVFVARSEIVCADLGGLARFEPVSERTDVI